MAPIRLLAQGSGAPWPIAASMCTDSSYARSGMVCCMWCAYYALTSESHAPHRTGDADGDPRPCAYIPLLVRRGKMRTLTSEVRSWAPTRRTIPAPPPPPCPAESSSACGSAVVACCVGRQDRAVRTQRRACEYPRCPLLCVGL